MESQEIALIISGTGVVVSATVSFLVARWVAKRAVTVERLRNASLSYDRVQNTLKEVELTWDPDGAKNPEQAVRLLQQLYAEQASVVGCAALRGTQDQTREKIDGLEMALYATGGVWFENLPDGGTRTRTIDDFCQDIKSLCCPPER